MCNIEGYCYANNDNTTRANLFKDDLQLHFVFTANRSFFNVLHIASECGFESSVEKPIYMDSNEDKSPDLKKLQDARLKYLK